MQLRVTIALMAAGVATALAGCEPNQLYIASHTVVGVNAAVNPEMTEGAIYVGYDRSFATIIPRSVTTVDKRTNAAKKEAMTSMACSSLAVSGITIKYFSESIATGEAAQTFAESLGVTDIRKVKDFFNCFKDASNPPAAPAAASGGAKP
ncbi:MAG: hypothetical protein JOY64_29825 [Alphaproteobacteria bacterium]|nr:hypothetical protein [Alphaproteobacteria bacterium]MBV8411861.1 hypothetical protein [Alphaproteobacteria bacterium]